MKTYKPVLTLILIIGIFPASLLSQKTRNSGNQITSADLETHVSFLASPLLRGRMNGEDGLDIAAAYLASQAKLTGLKPANGTSYFQPYSVLRKTMDPDKTFVQVISENSDTVTIKEQILQLVPTGPSDLTLSGEVIFAGYGIKADKYNYNDFEALKTEGKILLIMDRAPMSDDGKKCQFDEQSWISPMNFQMKITTLILSKAKAILFVSDPKSGYKSFEESNSGIAGFLMSSVTLSGEKEEVVNPFMAMMPKVIFIHRAVADELLEGTGHSLEELQNSIDKTMEPHSFSISGKRLNINEVTITEKKILNNVAGYFEGSDPVLKNEFLIFSSHYDHIGASGNKINTGADDNASGCAALISMADACNSLKKKPKRSILFLWVSGEEIGLFGSQSYVEHPLFPLDKTVADLNMDMIGRVKGIADSTSDTPMSGPNSVFVITGNQSKELLAIADKIDKNTILDFDYSLSGRDNPLQLFSRSDHYNFVKKDIPVLFFTTGIHTDYHTPGDSVEKLDFNKMELITRTMYDIGLNVANMKKRLVVDNPFSSWGKSK